MKNINMQYYEFAIELLQKEDDCLEKSPLQISLLMRRLLESNHPNQVAQELAEVLTLAQPEVGLKSICY